MTLEEYKKLKPPNVEEYDPPIATNPNPTQEQIDTAKRILEKYGWIYDYLFYLMRSDKVKDENDNNETKAKIGF